jgi:hypothetical protein
MEPVNNSAAVRLLIDYHDVLDLGWLIALPLFGCRAATLIRLQSHFEEA